MIAQSVTKTNENFSFAKGELGAKAPSPCFCGSNTKKLFPVKHFLLKFFLIFDLKNI